MKSKEEMAESKFDSSSSNTFPFADNDCSALAEDDNHMAGISKHKNIVKRRFVILYYDDDDLRNLMYLFRLCIGSLLTLDLFVSP